MTSRADRGDVGELEQPPVAEQGDVRPTPRAGASAEVERARERLAALRQQVEVNPFVNPIQLLALEISRALPPGAAAEAQIEPTIQCLTGRAVADRARNIRTYLVEIGTAANEERLRAAVRALAIDETGQPVSFTAFRPMIERTAYGFVVTAHPTFALGRELQRDLLALAFEQDGDGEQVAALRRRLEATPHRPDAAVDLMQEHLRSVEAVQHLRAAIAHAYAVILDVAAELYPQEWRSLVPRLLSVATWVGFDTDGRSDIPWTSTLQKRLDGKLEQLRTIRDRVVGIMARHRDDQATPLLELLDARLALAARTTTEQMARLADLRKEPDSGERLAIFSRAMVENRADALTDAGQIVSLVERALTAARDDGLARDLSVLRAEVTGHGLALARAHLRINAVQLHNAVRRQIGLDHPPDDPSNRSSYLEAMAKLTDAAEAAAINFADLDGERATARRVMMTAAQMLKLIDGGEPIRFLIAECETAFTLITALYFAKLYGVAGRIDISPLFETAKALERGPAILDEALAVPAFRHYVQTRKRLCVQAGYSDAGRYLGQLAAAVAIEKLRLGIIAVLQKHELTDVAVVMFDTHGESIGRGGHPASMLDRLRYFDTAESRRRYAAAGVAICQETSFQGGDGYLWFLSEASAFAVVTDVLEMMLAKDEATAADPFYTEQAYTDEFFATIRQFNARVIGDPCYAALLSAFGTNLIYTTGSRAVRRQIDGVVTRPSLEHPSQIRAIPHNAILQQLGILANTIGGLGLAVAKDPEHFQRLYRLSDRFRRLMMMVEHAFKFTDLQVVQCYLQLFDPGWWLARAAAERDAAGQEELLQVAELIERLGLSDRLWRIFRVFERDYLALAEALRIHRRLTRNSGIAPIAVDPSTRDNIHLLHAHRLALIERMMRRAVHVPDFSDRHVLTHDDLVAAMMQLEIEPVVRMLSEIFPVVEQARLDLDMGEPSTWEGEGGQSYAQEHVTIFRPIAREYDLIRRIGNALVHHLGAVG